jgi:hypothetical protein
MTVPLGYPVVVPQCGLVVFEVLDQVAAAAVFAQLVTENVPFFIPGWGVGVALKETLTVL